MTQESRSESEHILALAKEIIDGIESDQLTAEPLIQKTSRLDRALGAEDFALYLRWEATGIDLKHESAVAYLRGTGRYREPLRLSIVAPLPAIEVAIDQMQRDLNRQLAGHRPDLPEHTAISVLRKNLAGYRYILLSVRNLFHIFVTKVYYEKLFSGIAESVFGRFKGQVDALLAGRCGDVLAKMPAVYDRLSEGDAEALSQALNTCRRVIDTFADAVFPPTDSTREIGGKTVQLGPSHHQNRINAYIRDRTTSSSRRTKLRQTLSNLYARVSTGIHTDVTSSEAQALTLETYLLLGEVLTLGDVPPPPEPTSVASESKPAPPEPG